MTLQTPHMVFSSRSDPENNFLRFGRVVVKHPDKTQLDKSLALYNRSLGVTLNSVRRFRMVP